MTELAYAVVDGAIVQTASDLCWAKELDSGLPKGDVYVFRSFDYASKWRVLQRRREPYGLCSTSAQILPITFEQLPEVVRLAFMLVD